MDHLRVNIFLKYIISIGRGCRDIFFFILYVIFWVGLIIIAGVALKNGDPRRLATPFDPNGNHILFCKYYNKVINVDMMLLSFLTYILE